MTIKEELMHVLERITATLPSRKVTLILCCEGNREPISLYGSRNRNGDITIVSVTAPQATITNILNLTFNETEKTRH